MLPPVAPRPLGLLSTKNSLAPSLLLRQTNRSLKTLLHNASPSQSGARHLQHLKQQIAAKQQKEAVEKERDRKEDMQWEQTYWREAEANQKRLRLFYSKVREENMPREKLEQIWTSASVPELPKENSWSYKKMHSGTSLDSASSENLASKYGQAGAEILQALQTQVKSLKEEKDKIQKVVWQQKDQQLKQRLKEKKKNKVIQMHQMSFNRHTGKATSQEDIPITELRKLQATDENSIDALEAARRRRELEAKMNEDRKKLQQARIDAFMQGAKRSVGKTFEQLRADYAKINIGEVEGDSKFTNKAVPKHPMKDKQYQEDDGKGYWQALPFDTADYLLKQREIMTQQKTLDLMTKTKKTFTHEAEDHLISEEISQNLNRNTLLKHHPTVPSLLVPMYDPVRSEIMNPRNALAAGSTITLGLTDEQKDEEKKWELERRRIATANLQIEERAKVMEGKSSLVTGVKSKSIADQLKMFEKTNKYIAKYETILQERGEEAKQFQSRQKRFHTMQGVVTELKETLIRAAYPRGGVVAYKLMGDTTEIPDFRKDEALEFQVKSLKERHGNKKVDLQSLKLKALSEKFDAPKRVEIKELEHGLRRLVEFKDLGKSKKRQIVCRELAFIIQDLTLLYNMAHTGGPRIKKEFMGYETQDDEKRVYGAKKSEFKYFNKGSHKRNRKRYPISDALNNSPSKPNSDEENYANHGSDDHFSDDQPPMSEQEHELHKVRDRIRVRLQLMDVDYRNLETEILVLMQKRKREQERLAGILDHDDNNESEKEKDSTDSESKLTDVQRCILQNKRLMYKQEQTGFKDVMLETLANQQRAAGNPARWVNIVKKEKVRLDQIASEDLYKQDIVKYYTEDQIHIPAFRKPAEGVYEEHQAKKYKESEEYVSPVRIRGKGKTAMTQKKDEIGEKYILIQQLITQKKERAPSPSKAEQLAQKKARMDVINVIEVKMPTEKEKAALRRPDLNKLINRGLAISVNIGEDEEEAVYGHRQDRRFPPANNKLRARKFTGKSLAAVGF